MSSAKSGYAFRGIVSHLFSHQDWRRLFTLLDTKPFLSDQAERLGGFQACGDDLESFALRAAIVAEDWNRFLHYAALALNLRGLAEDLAEPEILRALARNGRLPLAIDAAGRLPDPLRRAEGFAAVASGLADDPRREEALGLLLDILDKVAAPQDDGSRSAEALATIAREIGPDPRLKDRWPEWIERLAPGRAAQVWQALAEGWLRRGEAQAPELWQALKALDSPAEILAFAPARLGNLNLEAPREILARLNALLPDPRDRQQAAAILLGQLAGKHPERARATWETWSIAYPTAWSAELIDLGRQVIRLLPARRIDEIDAALEDPTARAALRIIVLEARSDTETMSAALAALRGVPDGLAKLHWSLRFLTARPAQTRDEIRRQIVAAGGYLHAIRFAADILDIARWLDLVARFLPDDLESQLDCVLWSPCLTAETVPILADMATQAAIPSLLLERAERSAAALSPTEAEGFALRRELLIRAACRLCELTRCIDELPRVTARLLPEEEDELRACLAPRLSALPKADPPLSWEVCNGIGDRRLRLLTFLRSAPDAPAEVLTPASLYAAVARVDALLDEQLGLAALLETPHDPRDLLQRLILPIREPRIRTRAMLRLARHTLVFETASRSRPDLLAPLELVRWLMTTETDEELAVLTPEIAALGVAAGGARSTAEVQEAARRLAALESVPWPVRREALEDLLARMASGLLSSSKAATALSAIARLPAQLRPETARQELGRHWSEILPLIVAAADTLRAKDLVGVRGALQEGMSGLSPNEAQRRIFTLCLAAPTERVQAIESTTENINISVLQALAYLLVKPCPGRVPEVVRRLPGSDQERLVVRLLRYGWLSGEAGHALRSCEIGAAADIEAEVWCGPRPGGEVDWSKRAALWMATVAPIPSDPGAEPLLARLWGAPDLWRHTLAAYLTDALRQGGRHRGEAFLQTWMHAHLAPTPGQGRPGRPCHAVETALGRALRLGPIGGQP
jgi:hypothetical protein